ncbi:hypothetical protein PRUB_a0881 [Pseudoalteromonas rubra]|uniref:Uncharacterized protein n=1 Tax=Pseudoalteromonas rubra TaxID=43658 RepID=A0A8T0C6I0_9GAMM|nr:hypothetical protein PRUB_a0881 [Pseudoalteromonas rubra]
MSVKNSHGGNIDLILNEIAGGSVYAYAALFNSRQTILTEYERCLG